jgi:hypothetical protein
MLSTLNLRGALLGALASLLLTAPALGQETFAGDPLSLVRRLVDTAPIDDPTPYQGTDVNLSRLRGSIVKALVKVDRVELVEAKEQSAVAAAEFTPRIGGQSRAWDEYFYLSAEPSWKVVAHGRPRCRHGGWTRGGWVTNRKMSFAHFSQAGGHRLNRSRSCLSCVRPRSFMEQTGK